MFRTSSPDKILAGQLAHAIDADRSRTISFDVWRAASIIESENIIGAVVNQDAIQIAAHDGKMTHPPSVDGEGRVRLAFGPVHIIVGRTIKNRVGPVITQL